MPDAPPPSPPDFTGETYSYDDARRRAPQVWITDLVDCSRVARVHSRAWVQLSKAGQMIGPHDLIVAATALHRRWAVATFNAREFRHVPGLEVLEP